MGLNKRVFLHEEAAADGGGTGNQEEGLILHLDANDVDSYDGDGDVWYDITNYDYTPATDVSEHFNTVTYTGDNTSDRDITVGFQPDLVWVKTRSTSASHTLFDSLRGAGKHLFSNLNYAETTYSPNEGVTSFEADGFQITKGNQSLNNVTGRTYVAWCFKAGGAPTASNPIFVDGTGYSTLSAAGLDDSSNTNYSNLELSVNTDLGFSIVTANAPINPATARLPHGLGQEPEMVIHKATGQTYDWAVWHKDLTNKNYALFLNKTDAEDPFSNSNGGRFTGVNSTDVMYLQDSSDRDQVYYSFVSKRGVSKVGSYKGTGAAGNKVYTGFEPAWLMVKETSSTGNWRIMDNVRDTNNPKDLGLWANLNNAESSSSTNIVDFNADGFTVQGSGSDVNATSQSYIYLAFAAEKPSSLVDDTNLKLHIDIGNSSCYSGTGTTVNDLSSSNHTITTLAGVEAADFDKELGNFLTVKENSNEGLTIADHADFDHNNGATYEGWVYLDPSGTSEETLFYRGASNGQGLRIYWHSSYGWFPRDFNSSGTEILDQNNIKTGTTGYGRGKWYHLALTLSSNSDATYKFYVDGKFIGEHTASTGSGQNSQSYDISIGNYLNGTPDLQGAIGQFRYYNTALTADEVRQNYRFTKNDYPNGYNGTISGATYSASNSSFDFSGGDQIKGAATTKFTMTPGASLLVWFKTHAVNVDDGTYIVSNSDYVSGHVRNWTFYHRLTNLYFDLQGSTDNPITLTTSLAVDTWYFAVVTYDGATHKAYLSTTAQPTGTAVSDAYTGTPDTNSYPLIVGTDGNGTSAFNGEVGVVKFYDKALTLSEVQAAWNDTEATYNS